MLIDHFSTLIRGDSAINLQENVRPAPANGAFAAFLAALPDGLADTAHPKTAASLPDSGAEKESLGGQTERTDAPEGSHSDSYTAETMSEASEATPMDTDEVPASVNQPDGGRLTGGPEKDTGIYVAGSTANQTPQTDGAPKPDAEASLPAPGSVANSDSGTASKLRGSGAAPVAQGSHKEVATLPPTAIDTGRAYSPGALAPDTALAVSSQREQALAMSAAAADRAEVSRHDRGLKTGSATQDSSTEPAPYIRQAHGVLKSPMADAIAVAPSPTPVGFRGSTPSAPRFVISNAGEDWSVADTPPEFELDPQKPRRPFDGTLPEPSPAAASGHEERSKPPPAGTVDARNSERPQPTPVAASLTGVNAPIRGEPQTTGTISRTSPPLADTRPGLQPASAHGPKDMANPAPAGTAISPAIDRIQPPVGAALSGANVPTRGELQPTGVTRRAPLPPVDPRPGPPSAAAHGTKEVANPAPAGTAIHPAIEQTQQPPVGAVLSGANVPTRGELQPTGVTRRAPLPPVGPLPGLLSAAAHGQKEMANPVLAGTVIPPAIERTQPPLARAALSGANLPIRGELQPNGATRHAPLPPVYPRPSLPSAAAHGQKEMANPAPAGTAIFPAIEQTQPPPAGAVLASTNVPIRGEPQPTGTTRRATLPPVGPLPGQPFAATPEQKEMANPAPAGTAIPPATERTQLPVGAALTSANAPIRTEHQRTEAIRRVPHPPDNLPAAPNPTTVPFAGTGPVSDQPDEDGSRLGRVRKVTGETRLQIAEGSLSMAAAASSFAARPEHRLAAAHTTAGLARKTVQQIAAKVLDLGKGRFGLSLSPSELGKVDMWLQDSENRLTLTVNAERPETMDLIRRHIALLEQELRQMGLGNLSLQLGTGGTPDSQGGQSRERTTATESIAAQPEPALSGTGKPVARDHLDLRL